MNAELTKNLTDLIDETLAELEDLKKSRFAAAEVELKGPGEGIADKDSDGSLDAKKAEKAEDEDEEEKEEKEKAEKSDSEDSEDEDEEEEEEHEEKKEKKMKKSKKELSSLMKSYVDERVQPMEAKIEEIFALVEKIANQPVAPKGATAKAVPLMKSADEGYTPLSKADIASKLFDLKKSGAKVDSMDIVKADLGQELESIVKKYQIS